MWVNKRQIDEQDRNTLVYSDGYMFKNIFVLASITFKCTSCNTSQVFDIWFMLHFVIRICKDKIFFISWG